MKTLSNEDKLSKKIALANNADVKIAALTEKLKAERTKLKAYLKDIRKLEKLISTSNKVVSIKKGRPKKVAQA
jgi:hypothetical protein